MSTRYQVHYLPEVLQDPCNRALTVRRALEWAEDRGCVMAVDVTPKGTRGGQMPRLPGPFMSRMNAVVFRLFRGRSFFGMHLLQLTTIGAKSGQERVTTLAYVPDGDNAWLITGSAGGAASHPAWYFNLAKNPDKVWIRVGHRKIKVRPESLKGAARENAYRRFEQTAKSYSGYPQKTDREIPVVRLTAA